MRASLVKPARLRMLWRQRIPAGTLSVIAGKPGLGKSTLSLLIAAELSRRGEDVIVSNADGDDLAAVVRPRLEVAGADLERVHLVPTEAGLTLPKHVGDLEALVASTSAKAVILDPIASHFPNERRVHDRPTLRHLVQLARSYDCAIIGIHHTTKSVSGTTAIDLIGGPSGGLAGVARAVYLYGFDPDDVDQRALSCVKVNGVEEPPTLVFAHDVVEYRSSRVYVEAGKLRVVGEAQHSDARTVMHRGKSRADRDAAAVEWLTIFLAKGKDCTRPQREVRKAAAKAQFPWLCIDRASKTLKIEKARVGGWAQYGHSVWRLPDSHPARSPESELSQEVAGVDAA